MPLFPQRNNQSTSSTGGQPPQQPWQPISGVSMEVLEALMQIRMPQQRQMRPEARLNLLRYGDAFLFSLREVDLFNYFTGLVEYYRRGGTSIINLFKGILENLANVNRQDLIQLVRPLVPQNWDTMFAEGKSGQLVVLVKIPEAILWTVWAEFPVPGAQTGAQTSTDSDSDSN